MATRRRKKTSHRRKTSRKKARKSLMPESVIRSHARRLKKNPRAAKIYRKVLSCK